MISFLGAYNKINCWNHFNEIVSSEEQRTQRYDLVAEVLMLFLGPDLTVKVGEEPVNVKKVGEAPVGCSLEGKLIEEPVADNSEEITSVWNSLEEAFESFVAK